MPGVRALAGAIYPSRVTGALYSATASAAHYATRKLTERTFKPALRKALESICESFELDDDDGGGDGCTSVVARKLVLKRSVLDALFARIGLRLAAADDCPQGVAASISALRLVISWRARKDLGVFSEPWRLEVDDLHFHLRVGTAAARPAKAVKAVDAAAATREEADDSEDDENVQWYDAEEPVGDLFAVVGEFFAAEIAEESAEPESADSTAAPPLVRWEEPAPVEAPAETAATHAAQPPEEEAPAAPPVAKALAAEPSSAPAEPEPELAPVSEAPPKPDLLPLHRAAENLRLVMRRVRVSFVADAPLAAEATAEVEARPPGRSELWLGLEQLSLATTDGEWRELAGVRGVGDGATLFKLLTLSALEVVGVRPAPPDDAPEGPPPAPLAFPAPPADEPDAPHAPDPAAAPAAPPFEPPLQQRFAAAAAAARCVEGLSVAQRLRLYGLYKQSVAGPPDVAAPSRLAVHARAKWDAWHEASPLPREAAADEYCALVELFSGPSPAGDPLGPGGGGGSAAGAEPGVLAPAAAEAGGPEPVAADGGAGGDDGPQRRLWAELAVSAAGRRRTCVASCVDVDARITKQLQRQLEGRVVSDFAGSAYHIELGARCDAGPALALPRCRVVLTREADGHGGYDYIFRSDGGTHTQTLALRHAMRADDSREAMAWYRTLMEAKLRALEQRTAALDRQLRARANSKASNTDAVVVVSIDDADDADPLAAAPAAAGAAADAADGTAAVAGEAEAEPPPSPVAPAAAAPLSGAEVEAEVAQLRAEAAAAARRGREHEAAAAASAAALRVMGARVAALEAAVARLASNATRTQHGALLIHDALTNLMQAHPAPNRGTALVSALSVATTLRDDATAAAADGASVMNAAFVSGQRAEGGSASAPSADAPPATAAGVAAKSTWRDTAGRADGAEGYQFGDATKSLLRWAVGSSVSPQGGTAEGGNGELAATATSTRARDDAAGAAGEPAGQEARPRAAPTDLATE